MKQKIILPIIFLMLFSFSFFVSATTHTELGTYDIKEGDYITFPDVWADYTNTYTISILNIDLDPRNDSWYQYTDEPRVYFGGRGVGMVLHEGESGDMLLNPVSNTYVFSAKVNSIDVETKTASITVTKLGEEEANAETSNNEDFCEDSDNGKKYYQHGAVTYNLNSEETTTTSDKCLDDYILVEGFCEGNKYRSEIYYCSIEGKICSNGLCVDNETSETSCKDTDNGRNIYIQGSASSGNIVYVDECIESISLNADETPVYSCEEKNCFLREAECSGGKATYAKLACNTQCISGRCSATTSLDVNYFLVDKEGEYYLYIQPKHDNEVISNVYITAGFSSSSRVKSWSNNPSNKFPKDFEFDNYLNAYNVGSISNEEISEFDNLDVLLEFGDSEFKFWKISLNKITITILPNKEDEENTPTDIPESSERAYSCMGCKLENKCYPFGYRKEGQYCSDELEFTNQKIAESSCENNFECDSNLCINNDCVSGSLWAKFIRWLSKIFG